MKDVITLELLLKITGGIGSKSVLLGLVEFLPTHLDKYGVNTKLRLAHFLAQACHETDCFKTLREYASGAAYEGRIDLGNTHSGDGRRFRGRGIFQLTGRANYVKYGNILDVDLVNNPKLAETPEISVLTALEYWKSKDLNTFADADNIARITKRINGGYNGLADRKLRLARAKAALRKIVIDNVPNANSAISNSTQNLVLSKEAVNTIAKTVKSLPPNIKRTSKKVI